VSSSPAPAKTAAEPAWLADKPACTMAEMGVESEDLPDLATATTRTARLLLINKADHACKLGGWPTVTLVDSAQHDVAVPTTQVDESDRAVWFEMDPKGSEAAGTIVTWEVCSRFEADCPTGDSVRIGLTSDGSSYAELSWFPDSATQKITMASLEIDALGGAAWGP
jgi:hypothetical protein